MRFLLLIIFPFVNSKGISRHRPSPSERFFDSPLDSSSSSTIPCVSPPISDRLPPETKEKIQAIWKDFKGGDCWVEMARTRNILLQLPIELREKNEKKECKAPEIVRALPLRAQKRIMEIWKERDPNGECKEQQRRTRLILLNLPASLKILLHPPAFDCAPPHFIDRLESHLQERLRRIWEGYEPGSPCAERVDEQLSLLEKNDISLQSFQMPPPSMFRRWQLIRKLKRSSTA